MHTYTHITDIFTYKHQTCKHTHPHIHTHMTGCDQMPDGNNSRGKGLIYSSKSQRLETLVLLILGTW